MRPVNGSAAALAALLMNPDPEIYPSSARLSWESWYFRLVTLFWLAYGCQALVDDVGLSVERCDESWTGHVLVAVLLHTFSVNLRWWVSGRWPNSNMFEAVTTARGSAFFALAFEMFLPRSRCVDRCVGWRVQNGGIDVCPLRTTVSRPRFPT